MTDSPADRPAPGWYEDPQQSSMLRWWDGGRWTNDIRPMDPTHSAGSSEDQWGLRPVGDWMTENFRLAFGNEPVSMYFTHVRLTPSGTSCSLLHAIVQAWQPIHESLSSKNPSRVIASLFSCTHVNGRRPDGGRRRSQFGAKRTTSLAPNFAEGYRLDLWLPIGTPYVPTRFQSSGSTRRIAGGDRSCCPPRFLNWPHSKSVL